MGFSTSPPQRDLNETRKGLHIGLRLLDTTCTLQRVTVKRQFIRSFQMKSRWEKHAPLFCEPAAKRSLSACRTPGRDQTTTNTDKYTSKDVEKTIIEIELNIRAN